MLPKAILLVEDNLTNQKIISQQLKSLGYAVEIVPDGYAAVQQTAHRQYDLILMDCHLPGMDGFETTIAIRQQEQSAVAKAALSSEQSHVYPAIIIAMTASDSPRDQERAIAAGMNDYIRKPIQRSGLEIILERWMQKLKTPDQTSSFPTAEISSAAQRMAVPPLEAYLDLHYLHQLSDHSPEFELELLQIFHQDSHDYLAILRLAIEQQNYSLAEQAAHHLNGSSANIGAKLIQSAAAELEQQAHQKQFQSIEFLLAEIEVSLNYIQEYLTQSPSKTS